MLKIFKKFKKDDKVVEIKDFDKEQKKRARKNRRKQKVEETKKFVVENKELVVTIVVTGITGIATIVKKTSKMMQLRHETNHRDKHIYDHSTGTYWELKKKISNSQREQLEQRKMNGEKTGQILRSMNLLK